MEVESLGVPGLDETNWEGNKLFFKGFGPDELQPHWLHRVGGVCMADKLKANN